MRLVAANVVWGAGAVAVAFVGFVWPLGGLLLLPLLALPTAAIFRVASTVVRERPDAGRADIAWPYRRAVAGSLGLGAMATVLGLILVTNVVAGIAQATPFGWVIATLAAWGLVALWSGALVVWPLVVDPARDGSPLGARLRLAAGLLLVDPVRFGGLGLVVAVIVIVSTVLTAAILTVSVAFVALLACRMAYPVADRLQPVVGDSP
jgi:uncharacterized membrane protein YesL